MCELTSVIKKVFPIQHSEPLAKNCSKLISKKLVLEDATQLKARYLYKVNKSQSVWGSRVGLKFHENAISESLIKKMK